MIDVDTYCYNLTGLHPAEMIQNHRYGSLIHPHDREYVLRELEKAQQANRTYFAVYRIITATHREKWVWEIGSPISGGESGFQIQLKGRVIELTGRNTEYVALSGYAERLESLREIDQAILVAQSSNEIALIALRALRRLAPSVRLNLVLLNLHENQAELFSVMDRSHEITNITIQVTPEVRRWWYSFGIASNDEKLFINRNDFELCFDPQIVEFVDKLGNYNYLVRLKSQGALVGILALGFDKQETLASPLISMANEVTNSLAIAITQRRLLEQLHTANQNLQNLSRRLVDLQEQERRFLARELHDEIGQSLTAIKINLESLENLSPEASQKRLEGSIQVVSQTLQQVRNLSLDLRPALLDELGLAATLRWYLERLAQWNDVETQFQETLRQERLPFEIETTLFRVAQEALTNVIRHAGARRVIVLLYQTDDLITLQVRDDGRGFHVTEALQAATMGKSLGLLSIQERLHLIGGRLEIHSNPGIGSEILAEVPFS
jgi:signal transduction histidine kinase